jgi:hypothetical protein
MVELEFLELSQIEASEIPRRFGHIVQSYYQTQVPAPVTARDKICALQRVLGEGQLFSVEREFGDEEAVNVLEYLFILKHFGEMP